MKTFLNLRLVISIFLLVSAGKIIKAEDEKMLLRTCKSFEIYSENLMIGRQAGQPIDNFIQSNERTYQEDKRRGIPADWRDFMYNMTHSLIELAYKENLGKTNEEKKISVQKFKKSVSKMCLNTMREGLFRKSI